MNLRSSGVILSDRTRSRFGENVTVLNSSELEIRFTSLSTDVFLEFCANKITIRTYFN